MPAPIFALAPPFEFTSSGAVAGLFLLSAVAPIVIVAGQRGRLSRQSVNVGLALLAATLGFCLPELTRLGKFGGAVAYWAVWCSVLFSQSLILSWLAMRETDPNAITYDPGSHPDDESHA